VAKAALSKAKPTSAKAATARPKRAAKPVVAAPVLVLSPQIGDAIYKGTFAGNDCVGGFSTCYATQTGVQQGPGTDPLASPAVYKFNFGGEDESSSLFATIDGTEFQISYDEATNFLSFLYSPGAGDPELHYFSIKQANDYALFYDADAILAGGIDLDNYFASNPGFSHITFFDTRPGGGTGGDGGTGGVPEPSTWAMMLLGFGGMGLAMRRRRRNGTLMQQMA
jgi:hypothetical protein